MAKAQTAPTGKGAAAAPAAGGSGKLMLMLGVCGVLAIGAGVALPFFVLPGLHGAEKKESTPTLTGKKAYIPMGDVVVNLNETTLTRYLRIKLLLVVDSAFEKELTEQVGKQKPELKNYLISYLSDKSLADVTGAPGINKLRREIWTEFNSRLSVDGREQIQDIIFEEFVVQ